MIPTLDIIVYMLFSFYGLGIAFALFTLLFFGWK